MTLPPQDIALIEEFKEAFEHIPMKKVERLIEIIERQQKALELAVQQRDHWINESNPNLVKVRTNYGNEKIAAILNGDLK